MEPPIAKVHAAACWHGLYIDRADTAQQDQRRWLTPKPPANSSAEMAIGCGHRITASLGGASARTGYGGKMVLVLVKGAGAGVGVVTDKRSAIRHESYCAGWPHLASKTDFIPNTTR